MKRTLIPVLIALSSASALAQDCETFSHPYMYLWDKVDLRFVPSNWREFGSQMVRDLVDGYQNDPFTAGQHFADKAWQQINIDQTTRQDKVCLVLQNFGIWKGSTASQVSLIDTADAIDATQPPWATLPLQPDWMPYGQPWMTQGRATVRTWMQNFLLGYKDHNGQPQRASSLTLRSTSCPVVRRTGRGSWRAWPAIRAGERVLAQVPRFRARG